MFEQKKKNILTAALTAVVFVFLNFLVNFFLLHFYPEIVVGNQNKLFGFELSSQILFLLSASVLAVLCVVWWMFFSDDYMLTLAFGLIVGGALTNILMRIIFGYALDYIDILLWRLHGVWNLADFGIIFGMLILIFKKPLRNVN